MSAPIDDSLTLGLFGIGSVTPPVTVVARGVVLPGPGRSNCRWPVPRTERHARVSGSMRPFRPPGARGAP
jgi:hypothetical protein